MQAGKPPSEAFVSILGGLLWGWLACRARSIVSGSLQHAFLGIGLTRLPAAERIPHLALRRRVLHAVPSDRMHDEPAAAADDSTKRVMKHRAPACWAWSAAS